MKAIRAFLGISALIWLPYGIFCFFQPSDYTMGGLFFEIASSGTALLFLSRVGAPASA